MHTKSVLCILVFTSCPEFIEIGVTDCGASVYASKTLGDGGFPAPTIDGGVAWTMDSLNKAEATALRLFNDTKDERLYDGCEKIKGLAIKVSEKPLWSDANGRTVAGQTYCAEPMFGLRPEIIIGSSRPSRSALAHEYAHVLQDCKPRGPADLLGGDDEVHAGWNRDGIYDALGWYWTQMEVMGL